jgi:16S rRNA (guanine527-N7)-methyltransferase
MTKDCISILVEDCKILGISLTKKQIDQFSIYFKLLLEWNKVMNLTAITEPEDIIKKHFVDSLSIINFERFQSDSWIIDIGTGAGFPGIPIKIAFPNTRVTLLDSLQKRITFLHKVIEELQLEDINAYHGRAEVYGHMHTYREQFDLCVSRAVAGLPTLLEYALPFVKKDGYFVAYKSEKIQTEISDADKFVTVLGGEIDKHYVFDLPNSTVKRTLFTIHKVNQTPGIFPRKPGIPLKKPMNDTFLKGNYDV